MVLIEQLASIYFESTARQLSFLIGEYEFNNEIAELRMGGYDGLARRLSELNSRKE